MVESFKALRTLDAWTLSNPDPIQYSIQRQGKGGRVAAMLLVPFVPLCCQYAEVRVLFYLRVVMRHRLWLHDGPDQAIASCR